MSPVTWVDLTSNGPGLPVTQQESTSDMLAVTESLFPIFVVVILGYILRKRDIISQDKWPGMEKVCFWVLFPALLVDTLATSDLSGSNLDNIAIVVICGLITMCALILIIRPFLMGSMQMSGPSFTSIFQASTRYNGFIALAIALKIYGEPGVAMVAISMAVLVPLINVINVVVMATYASQTRVPLKRIVKLLAYNPLILGCLVGITINLLEIPLWEPVSTTIDLLGRSALTIGLLCVGAGLKVRMALKPSAVVWLACSLKLLILPVIMAGWGLAFGLSGMAMQVTIIIAAVPTAMNGYILAKAMGGDADLFATTVTLQTILAFISIPFVIAIAEKSIL